MQKKFCSLEKKFSLITLKDTYISILLAYIHERGGSKGSCSRNPRLKYMKSEVMNLKKFKSDILKFEKRIFSSFLFSLGLRAKVGEKLFLGTLTIFFIFISVIFVIVLPLLVEGII